MPSKFHPITKINRHTTQYCTHNIEPINICTKKTATSENTVWYITDRMKKTTEKREQMSASFQKKNVLVFRAI